MMGGGGGGSTTIGGGGGGGQVRGSAAPGSSVRQQGMGAQGAAGGGGVGGGAAAAMPFAPRGPGPGADGNFTSTALAAHAAQNPSTSAEAIVVGAVAAQNYASDPFYTAYSYAIQREMAMRLAAA